MRIETKVLPAGKEAIAVAARILAEGGLVAFPTDTVYGVGAHAFQPDAVERIYTAKIRPRDKAIPILLARADDLTLVAGKWRLGRPRGRRWSPWPVATSQRRGSKSPRITLGWTGS